MVGQFLSALASLEIPNLDHVLVRCTEQERTLDPKSVYGLSTDGGYGPQVGKIFYIPNLTKTKIRKRERRLRSLH